MSNDKLRVGMIGTGNWAESFYLPNLKSHPNATLWALCGRNKVRAEELASKHGVPRVFTDYRRMLDAGDLDVAVICTPEDLHHPMTMAALGAGLHVICEKPLAYTAAQAREMYQKANEIGVKHRVTFTSRWLPHFRQLKALLDAILDDLPISPNFFDGYKVQQVIEAILESSKTGHTIAIDHSQ